MYHRFNGDEASDVWLIFSNLEEPNSSSKVSKQHRFGLSSTGFLYVRSSRSSIGSRNRDYNLHANGWCEVENDAGILGVFKFNPPDGELILTRRRVECGIIYDWRAIG